MLKDFVNTYGQLSDSIVIEVNFKVDINSPDKKLLETKIYCSNIISDFQYEIVKIQFLDIINLIFNDTEAFNNFAPKDVFITEKKDEIVFDFDPIDYFDYLEENPNSKFKVKCKNIIYGNVGNG